MIHTWASERANPSEFYFSCGPSNHGGTQGADDLIVVKTYNKKCEAYFEVYKAMLTIFDARPWSKCDATTTYYLGDFRKFVDRISS
jgi:hypothetical protein